MKNKPETGEEISIVLTGNKGFIGKGVVLDFLELLVLAREENFKLLSLDPNFYEYMLPVKIYENGDILHIPIQQIQIIENKFIYLKQN